MGAGDAGGLLLFSGSVTPALFRHLTSVCNAAWPGLGFWCTWPAWATGPWGADLTQIATARKTPDERQRIAFSNGFLSSKMFCCLIYDFFCSTGTWDEKAEGFLLFLSANSLSLPRICKFFSRIKVVAEAGLPLSCFIMLLTWTLNPAFLCCVLKVTAAVWS